MSGDHDETLVESTRASPRPTDLARGDAVGRYVILERLGSGGMGVVFAAYDPELGRKIALKLLHSQPNVDSKASEGHRRLLREAQAMARLAHPNVITVHDVGEREPGGTGPSQVFVAMEFVQGKTLTDWLADSERDWREIIDVFVDAGRGLAVAHEKGLVHRDFKPDNVMIGEDGRTRVMDFGLARSSGETDAPELRETDDAELQTGENEVALTKTGALLGTPAYMAPEQWNGRETDARTDQFSFCIALYEALYRQRPFSADGMGALALQVTAGKVQPPPKAAKAPGWLRKLVLRGLSTVPGDRFASMNALLAELSRGRARSRWRKLLVAGAVAPLVWIGVQTQAKLAHDEHVVACELAGASISESWNAESRVALAEALLGTGVSYAKTSTQTVLQAFDERADAWRDARTAACMDANVNRTWDEQTVARSDWCFDERRMEFDALLEELMRADASVAQKAGKAAVLMGSVEPCSDIELLRRSPAPPVDRLDEFAALRRELSRVGALERAGRYDEGLQLANAAVEHASMLDWASTQAYAEYRLGSLLALTSEYERAERSLENAYFQAATASDHDLAADIALELALLTGDVLARHTDALRWSRLAEVSLAQVDDPGSIRTAEHLDILGQVHAGMGDYTRAQEFHERALSIYEAKVGSLHPQVGGVLNHLGLVAWKSGDFDRATSLYQRAMQIQSDTLGPDHPDVATVLNNFAIVREAAGDHEEATELYERALAIWERTFGADHPDVAMTLNNLAVIAEATGDYTRAKSLFARAVEIWENKLGPQHPTVANGLNNLANAHDWLGERDRARALHQRALAIREAALGLDHPQVAESLNNLGAVHEMGGEYAEAKQLYERALVIQQHALGPEHPDVATLTDNLAFVHRLLGDHPQARRLHARALQLREKTLGPEHADVADSLVGLALVDLASNTPADALPTAERALQIRTDIDAPPHAVAQARFVLARAKWDAPRDRGRDRAQALELAKQARAGLRQDATAVEFKEVDAWLAKRGAG
jgi:tetratricopeptide (TPR) repeat protein/tRNA A-37 threonylcarbamoyl transferase component Bud32